MSPSLHVVSPVELSEAQRLDREVRSAARQYNTSFARMAYYGYRLKLIDGFEELGYSSEYAYMASLGVGKSWWYEALSVAEALYPLPLEEMEKLSVGQCQLLLQIKPEIRQSYQWTKEAQSDSYRDFAQKIEDRNRLVPGPEKVPMAPISIRVPAAAKGAIFQSLSEFQKKHQLSSIGQALEFAVTEKLQGESALACLKEAMQLMTGVSLSICKLEGTEQARQWLSLARDRVNDAYRQLLEASREDDGEVHEEAVYETAGSENTTDDGEREDDFFEQCAGSGREAESFSEATA